MAKGKTYSIFLDVELMDKLDNFCKRNHMSKSAYINDLLKSSLDTLDTLFADENMNSKSPKEAILLSGVNALTTHLNELISLQKELLNVRLDNNEKINRKTAR